MELLKDVVDVHIGHRIAEPVLEGVHRLQARVDILLVERLVDEVLDLTGVRLRVDADDRSREPCWDEDISAEPPRIDACLGLRKGRERIVPRFREGNDLV